MEINYREARRRAQHRHGVRGPHHTSGLGVVRGQIFGCGIGPQGHRAIASLSSGPRLATRVLRRHNQPALLNVPGAPTAGHHPAGVQLRGRAP